MFSDHGTPARCRSAGLAVTRVASKQYKGSLRRSAMQAQLKTHAAKGVAQCEAEGAECIFFSQRCFNETIKGGV